MKKRALSFDQYQRLAAKTAVYPDLGKGVYPALGLGGESGEVLEKVKKYHRDHPRHPDYFHGLGLIDGGIHDQVVEFEETARQKLKKELGDVLWYVSEVARSFHLTLSEIAAGNIEKLSNRQQAGTLHGSGDDR